MRSPSRSRILGALLLATLAPLAACGSGGSGTGGGVRTYGLLLKTEAASQDYRLFAPVSSTTTYLIDAEGRQIHTWTSAYGNPLGLYLLDDGSILRTSGAGGPETPFGGASGGQVRVERIRWDGEVVWTFEYATEERQIHHDIQPLSNGNVFLVAWELISVADAIAAGRDPALVDADGLWPDVIVEIEPSGSTSGTVVWEWHVWDHLVQDFDATKANHGVVADHPELIDVNFPLNDVSDWQHTNAIAYNAALDQIMLSANRFGELWILDHGTTPAEAAGHTGGRYGRGGDLLYRAGNPAAHRGGSEEDQFLFGQHDTHWMADGTANVLVFNNGGGRDGRGYSSVEELIPPYAPDGSYLLSPITGFEPPLPVWTWTAPNPRDFFARVMSGARRVANENTLICDAPRGRFFEVTLDGTVVWEYVNPVTADGILRWDEPLPERPGTARNTVFRVTPVPPTHPGLAGRGLTPGDPIEIGGP